MTRLTEILRRKGRLLTTEFLPPKIGNLSDLVNQTLKVGSVIDSVSLPELKANERSAPMFRMNPFYASLRLRDLTGIETLFHLTPRDYNKNALMGILLSATEARLNNVLVVGGDRYSETERSRVSKNVYDFKGATELIKGVRSFEAELHLGESERFCVVAGTDPTVIYSKDTKRTESEIAKLIERQDAGADLVQTQPVFDKRFLEFLDLARQQGLKIPVLVGIMPLRGRTDSQQIERRYGITIPTDVKSSLRESDERKGRRLACELASDFVKNGIQALHVYPRETYQVILDVAESAFGTSRSDLVEQWKGT